MFTNLSQPVVLALFEVSIKALVLYGIAALIIRVGRALTVHTQHRVWTVVLLMWLFMPLVMLGGLSWSLPVSHWHTEPTYADVNATADTPATVSTTNASLSDRSSVHLDELAETQRSTSQNHPINITGIDSTATAGGSPAELIREQLAKPEVASASTNEPRPLIYHALMTTWMVGVVVMLARLAFAMVRASAICQRARPLNEASLPRGVDVRESDDVNSPVVVGWWRPCILLPTTWREWTEAKRQAVLAHEQSHLQRGDAIVCLLAEILTVFYWFHPLSWNVKRRLGQLAELACDEAAAVETGDRFRYAQHLIEIASAIPSNARTPAGIAMARSSEISHRVRSLLNASRPLTSRASLPSLIAILILVVPSALLIAAAEPDTSPPAQTQTADRPPQPPTAQDAPTPVAPAAPAKEDLNQPPFKDPILTLRGTAYLPDGTLAKDAVIERSSFAPEGCSILSEEISEGQFAIRTTASRLIEPWILLHTPDRQFQTLIKPSGSQLRTDFMKPAQVTLSPARLIRVYVTDGNTPVPEANVCVYVGLFSRLEKTNHLGIAEIQVPKDEPLGMVAAWTENHRIGMCYAYSEPEMSEFKVSISNGETVRVRAVDHEQNPLTHVSLELSLTRSSSDREWIEGVPTSTQTTNNSGIAEFAWVPNWPQKRVDVNVASHSPWRRANRDELKPDVEGVYVVELAPKMQRVAVQGRLIGVTTDVTGMLVGLKSFQAQEESRSDTIYSRTDAQGRFVAHVLPGSTYCAFVDDNEYVSQIWDGLVADWDGTILKKPEIALTNGAKVDFLLTAGAEKHPIVNGWVSFRSQRNITFRYRDGSKMSGDLGRDSWARTNERGEATVLVAPGKLEVSARAGEWRAEKTIQVVEGQPAKVHFHRKFPDQETLQGKLILPAGVTADLSNTEIKIEGMDGESNDSVTVTSDSDGNFTGRIAAGRVSILATSPGEKFFGCGIFDVRDKLIEVPIHPTVPYQGQVLGTNNEPIPGVSVRMMARLTDHQREYPSGTPAYKHQFVDLFKNRVVTTDASGQFLFPQTPQRMELYLRFTPPGETESETSRQVYLEPGSVCPAQVVRLGANNTSAPRPQKPLNESLAQTVLDCQLAGIHPLVVVLGEGDPIARFVGTHITDPEMPHDSYSYYPRPINGPAAEAAPDRKEYFAAHNWPFPAKNAAFLVALDGNGKELGRLSVDLKDEPAAAKEVAAFLKQNLPPKVDARVGFIAAQAEAKKSGRRLWARVGQTRCGPCFTFSRWLNEHKDVLEKDYVLFKFDDIRDLHGHDLSKALKFDAHGVPCHAIYDGDGKELINSVGPQGNIGSPVGDLDAVGHLRKMLDTTAQNITAEEIEMLIRSLNHE